MNYDEAMNVIDGDPILFAKVLMNMDMKIMESKTFVNHVCSSNINVMRGLKEDNPSLTNSECTGIILSLMAIELLYQHGTDDINKLPQLELMDLFMGNNLN